MKDSKRNWADAAVIITGAGSGLGLAIAQLLALMGARLLLVGRDEKKLQRCCNKIQGNNIAYFAGDVGEARFCRSVLERADVLFGRVDVLINNAGMIYRAKTTQTPDDIWEQTMRVNLDAIFWLSRETIKRMRKQKKKGGAIVNIASTVGLVGAEGLTAYCTSKGGVVQLTRAMALDYASEGITVNAVCPGAMDTPMLFSGHDASVTEDCVRKNNLSTIPMRRLAQPSEVARAVVFLASEPYITGVMLPVDGGYTAQ